MNISKFIYKNIDRIVCTSGFIGTWVYMKYTTNECQANIDTVRKNMDELNGNINDIKELTINLKELTNNLIKYHDQTIETPAKKCDEKQLDLIIQDLDAEEEPDTIINI